MGNHVILPINITEGNLYSSNDKINVPYKVHDK